MQCRPNLNSILEDLKRFTGKIKNSDLMYYVLCNFKKEKEQRIQLQNELILAKHEIEVLKGLIHK